MDYLVYAYLQKGDNRLAKEQLDYLQNIKTISGATSPYNFTAIPVRFVLENKRWADAAEIDFLESNFQMENYPWSKALVHFARSLGAARSGDLNKAEREKDILLSLHQSLLNENDLYKANQVMIQVKAAQAWIELSKGNSKEALDLMKESVDLESNTEKHPVTPGEVLPAYELLGDLLMEINNPSEALVAYEKSLELSPNRFNGIYGAAIAAEGAGDKEKAIMYFTLLIERAEISNSDRTELTEAKEFIRHNVS
jgi:tetratricopeptide (TPR) repeat protein